MASCGRWAMRLVPTLSCKRNEMKCDLKGAQLAATHSRYEPKPFWYLYFSLDSKLVTGIASSIVMWLTLIQVAFEVQLRQLRGNSLGIDQCFHYKRVASCEWSTHCKQPLNQLAWKFRRSVAVECCVPQ